MNAATNMGLTSPSIGCTAISETPDQSRLSGGLDGKIHTARHASGEIRGQVIPAPVPLPATLPLLPVSATAFLAARSRCI